MSSVVLRLGAEVRRSGRKRHGVSEALDGRRYRADSGTPSKRFYTLSRVRLSLLIHAVCMRPVHWKSEKSKERIVSAPRVDELLIDDYRSHGEEDFSAGQNVHVHMLEAMHLRWYQQAPGPDAVSCIAKTSSSQE